MASAQQRSKTKAPAKKKGNGVSATAPTKNQLIEIPGIHIVELTVPIIGTSPLITQAWSTGKLVEIEKGRLSGIKPPKRAMDDAGKLKTFNEAIYWIDEKKKRYGFPATGLKKALVRAAKSVDGLAMADARGLFHVLPEDGSNFVEIFGEPYMRMDTVRLQGKVMDLRYRPCWNKWHANVRIEFNENLITPSSIANLFQLAGFGTGIGEWRPERDGPYGKFRVDKKKFASLVSV